MKKLFAYFKHPTESIAKEDAASIKSLILFYILMQGIYLLVGIAFELVVNTPDIDYTQAFEKRSFGFLLLVPLILEELVFRLPLKRNRINFVIFFVIICWIIISFSLSTGLITSKRLWLRLSISIPVGLLLGSFLSYPLQKMRYGVWFYVMAFIFGLIHIFNCDGEITSFVIALDVLLYALNKAVLGMFLGYIRVRYSIFASIAVHFLNNFIPMLMLYIAYQNNML